MKALIDKTRGMTLIELVIVVAVMGILLSMAVPSYSSYMLRVHRTEAIRMLLQASMCQQRMYASRGSYDTNECRPTSEFQRYLISYAASDTQSRNYTVMATPQGVQHDDACGTLLLDQNGAMSISTDDISAIKCWNAR